MRLQAGTSNQVTPGGRARRQGRLSRPEPSTTTCAPQRCVQDSSDHNHAHLQTSLCYSQSHGLSTITYAPHDWFTPGAAQCQSIQFSHLLSRPWPSMST